MSNPIENGPRLNGALIGGTRNQATNGTGGAADKQGSAPTTSLESGATSERLQLLRERIDSTPEVNLARVEELKQRIADGKYPIDPERIAEKFADLESLLNG